MSDKYCHDIDKCCSNMNCTGNKKNCSTECCSGLPEEINPNLAMAKSFPILAERIFDCMILENPQFAVSPAKFNITTTAPTGSSYSTTDKICIDEICLSYDLIAPSISSTTNALAGTITACSRPVLPMPVIGSITTIGTKADQGGGEGEGEGEGNSTPLNVSNHYRFDLVNNSCCHKHGIPQDGSKCRFIEQGLNFYIYNLQVFVTGQIGCVPFSAKYMPANPVTLSSALGFPTTLNFFGKACVPDESKNSIVDERFSSCLSIDCIDTTNSSYNAPVGQNPAYFNANIESSLIIKKAINILVEEKLSVLAVPASENQQCHGSDVHCEPCHNKCRD